MNKFNERAREIYVPKAGMQDFIENEKFVTHTLFHLPTA